MRKIGKNFLSAAIMFCMVVSLFSGLTLTANADGETHATSITYCGQAVNESTPYIVLKSARWEPVKLEARDNTTLGQNETLLAEFDHNTGTLTYKDGFAISSKKNENNETPYMWNNRQEMVKDVTDVYRGIKAEGNLIIDVGIYDNWLFVDANKPNDGSIVGIEVSGDLTIKGTLGSLRVNGQPSYSSETATA